jgi:hypothetical protein
VREAIGAFTQSTSQILSHESYKTEEVRYLIEFKFLTDSSLRSQFARAKGWDFRVVRRTELKKSFLEVALYKWIDQEVYEGLLGPMEYPFEIRKCSWDLNGLRDKAKTNPDANWAYEYIQDYFFQGSLEVGACSDEQIRVFPTTLCRSSLVAKKIGHQVVVLTGDASSKVGWTRGVSKGLIEAAFCAKAVSRYILRTELLAKKTEAEGEKPEELTEYEKETSELYEREKWRDEWRFQEGQFCTIL